MAKKWLDSIEKQGRISNVVTNGHTNRQSQRQKIVENRLLG